MDCMRTPSRYLPNRFVIRIINMARWLVVSGPTLDPQLALSLAISLSLRAPLENHTGLIN